MTYLRPIAAALLLSGALALTPAAHAEGDVEPAVKEFLPLGRLHAGLDDGARR